MRTLSTVCIVLRMIDTRDQQRAWLKKVIAQTGLAPTALAVSSGLAVTTLTRFLNDPDHGSALSARTIGAIERTTGVRFGDEPRPLSLREPETEPYNYEQGDPQLTAILRQVLGTANGVDCMILRSRALESSSLVPGDILIVDMNKQPIGGDVVCAQVYDWPRGRAETVFRIWEPPYLVAATMDPRLRRPYAVDNENVVIKGVMIASLRPRMARAAA
jgi:hypothetical protein